MGPIKLIKMARSARKQWQALPAAERELLRRDAGRVRDLSAELAGTAGRHAGHARRPPGDAADATDGARDGTPDDRALRDIGGELSVAMLDLSRKVAPRTAATARQHAPRSVRFGARAARFGLRQARRLDPARGAPAGGSQESVPSSAAGEGSPDA